MDWMWQVWTGCDKCGLDAAGVDWTWQLCRLDVAGADWMWQMWTGCDRCELDVAGADWMWQMWTGCGTECGQVDVAGVDWMWAVGPCGLDV